MSELLNNIIHTYSQFFDWSMWGEVLTDPVSWGLIGTLILMEGLLSADNALVLAVMVRHLPENQRKKALFYGLLGAYAFRFLAIGIGVYLIKISWVKIIGALYLAWLSFKYFRDKRKKQANEDEDVQGMSKNSLLIRMFGNLWGTVVAVEMMDIAFSVDSVLAAFGVSEQIWVLLIGGMIGVLMMRGVAGVFLKLIDKIPELETAAYVLIGFISLKMLLSVAKIDIPHAIFFIFILIIFGTTILIHFQKEKKLKSNR
ncbi:TerC family protein [Peribacillus sp. NPDC097295]|uniref:TerC family protein n=1 Tax=Peribacillus sp. NPDC097295 TaxID=3364402 RepID=UPI003805FCCC